MRRAAGSHIRTNRQKLALLQRTTLEDRKIAPSLRSNHVKRILRKHEQSQKPSEQDRATPEFSLVVDRPPATRHAPRGKRIFGDATTAPTIQMMIVSTPNLPKTSICLTVEDFTEPLRRRSLPKEESPRSGLKPHDTLGADDRRQSACSIAERRIEEHRKYSSYGIDNPVPINICGLQAPTRSPSITYQRQPVRSLSAGWKESFRRKLNYFRRPSPSSLSSRSTQQFLTPSPEMSCKSNPEPAKVQFEVE
ncbi:unnamed protein product [Caenorhabditis brenneri]